MTIPLSALRRCSLAVLLLSVALATALGACQGPGSPPATSIVLGTTSSEVNALILIAQELGYFASNGLNAAHRTYPSGVAALDGLFKGEVDLATGSEFAFVNRVLAEQDICTLGAISRSSIEYLVGRIDRGLETLDDLEGKTIGLPLGSRPEFALDRYLYLHGIDAATVTLVDVPVDRAEEALVNGDVDAVGAWQPYVDRIRARLGPGVVTWSLQQDQPSYTLLMCKGEWADTHKELLTRFLSALVQAESYIVHNPDAARAAIQEQLDYSPDYMASVWPDYSFALLLDQARVVAMEDQARWIISNNLSPDRQTPDFLDYIYFDGLETVKPEAVNVIR
jgi:ABC-type nitrate/sulfonate/bicarbonate transport system substrate-binding protein